MEKRHPACGDETAHEAHGVWQYSYTVWVDCPGWTETEVATSALIERMNQVARDHWPVLPDDVALECNPWVSYLIQGMLIPRYAEFVENLESGGGGMMKLQVPVIASPAMERGAWKIVNDRAVIAEGTIPLVLAGEKA